jgi:alkylated DNA repair dioxygenase AlkB
MQQFLFDAGPEPPQGFNYLADFLTEQEESDLLEIVRGLPFAPYKYREFTGNRRIVSFGWSYSFDTGTISEAAGLPEFLLPLRERAAQWAGVPSDELVQALVTEYPIGAAIGWHRDAPPFGTILGISLLSDCPFRLRLEEEKGYREFHVERRSIYALTGPARSRWQHGIPPAKELRYSITFRSLRRRF